MFDNSQRDGYNILRTIAREMGLYPQRRAFLMRLDLRDVIHVPDAKKAFQYQLDLSGLDFWGRKPITRPVSVEGSVANHAGA